jgi:hypothetical protein
VHTKQDKEAQDRGSEPKDQGNYISSNLYNRTKQAQVKYLTIRGPSVVCLETLILATTNLSQKGIKQLFLSSTNCDMQGTSDMKISS